MNGRPGWHWVFGGLVLLLAGGLAAGPEAGADEQEMEELRERFRQRLPQIQPLKREAKAGETWEGFLEAVGSEGELSAAERGVLEEENSDRRRLYQLLARRLETTPERVGVRNGLRNFGQARSGERLRFFDGRWMTQPHYSRLSQMKQRGWIGETSEGWVEVTPDHAARMEAQQLAEAENRQRRAQYERLAERQNRTVAQVARETARRLFEHAQPGEMLKQPDGRWIRVPAR